MGEAVVDISHTPAEPEQPDEIDLLTDVLAALHRAVQDRKTQLEPRDMAAMAATVLRRSAGRRREKAFDIKDFKPYRPADRL